MITKDREYRSFTMEPVEGKGFVIEGYAVVFDSPRVMYEDTNGNKYYEKISREAFNKTDMTDVVLTVDHAGRPLARTRNNTLVLKIDDKGLYVRATLKTDEGKKLYAEIEQGLFDQMSFQFTIEEMEFDKISRTNNIKSIKKLYDVSVVTRGAYETTSVFARSFYKEQAEQNRKQDKLELLKNKYNYLTSE